MNNKNKEMIMKNICSRDVHMQNLPVHVATRYINPWTWAHDHPSKLENFDHEV